MVLLRAVQLTRSKAVFSLVLIFIMFWIFFVFFSAICLISTSLFVFIKLWTTLFEKGPRTLQRSLADDGALWCTNGQLG